MSSLPLLEQHVRLLEASAIRCDVARRRGYLSASTPQTLRQHGFSTGQAKLVPPLVIPLHGVTGDVLFHQMRSDHPRSSAGKVVKYETPHGARSVLDVHPFMVGRLGDPGDPLLITEGIRKADSATSRGMTTIGLIGVWMWRGSNEDGGKTVLPDWEFLALNGRHVYVAFDSDAMTKRSVQGALERLGRLLEYRGAVVHVVRLEPGPGGAKVGLDDYLACGGDLDELLKKAELMQVRSGQDALGTHPASDKGDGGASASVSASASLRPSLYKDAGDGRTSTTPSAEDDRPHLEAQNADAFAAVDEASADPILGDDENAILVAGGSAVYYGDGGAGKTTLGLDRAVHLCAGTDWLGLPIPKPVRLLWVENEGPRGKFRLKVRAKLAAWDGPELAGRLHVLSEPWARFTFADPGMRTELVAIVDELEIDLVIAGPVARLGAEGGGTPKEIQAFVDLLEGVRADLGRPLAYELIHHENKAGDVSGSWEGATDSLCHVQARGNGHTAVVWRKTRWAPELHGRTWKLDWRAGERYELDTADELTDEDIADRLVALVREAPGGSWNSYDGLLEGQSQRKRAIRDRLLEDGQLVNAGTAKAMRLSLPGQVG